MTTKTVTEGTYNRAYIFTWTSFLVGFLLMLAGGIGIAYFSVESAESAAAVALLFFGAYLWSASNAIGKRGIWHRVWSVAADIPWTMDDIDTEEFADGPVEVEVNDDG